MKKIAVLFTTIITSIIMMCGGMNAFAHDYPYSWADEKSDVNMYFGEILCTHRFGDRANVNVRALGVIKGEIKKDDSFFYPNVNMSKDVKLSRNGVYLIAASPDGTAAWAFNVTGYDTKTLKLVEVDESWKALEQFLNEGVYGECKLEGVETSPVKYVGPLKRFLLVLSSNPTRVEIISIIIRLTLIALIILAIFFIRKKKADKRKLLNEPIK